MSEASPSDATSGVPAQEAQQPQQAQRPMEGAEHDASTLQEWSSDVQGRPRPRREHSGLGGGGCSAGREDRTVRESPLKDNLRYLAERAVQKVASGDHPLAYFAGATALYDTRRDQAITELPAFEDARIALGAVSVVQKRYGPSPVWERLTLQFVYGFLGNLSGPTFDTDIFETTWEAFWEELSDPEWTWMGILVIHSI